MAKRTQARNPRKRKSLTIRRLKEVLHYNPTTGLWTWMVNLGRARIGATAGCRRKGGLGEGGGYLVIRIDRRLYRAHRLAVFYVTGKWPPITVDHEDRDRANNKWLNLRNASVSSNHGNRKAHSSNTSGFKGVSFDKRKRKWQAQIQKDGRRPYLGYFDTPEEAHEAYCRAARELFGEFFRAK